MCQNQQLTTHHRHRRRQRQMANRTIHLPNPRRPPIPHLQQYHVEVRAARQNQMQGMTRVLKPKQKRSLLPIIVKG